MEMMFGAKIAGKARDPWNLGPGELAPVAVVQGRPSWQATRWPVTPEEYAQLIEAARQPDVTALEAAAAVADAGTPEATTPTVGDSFDGIPRTGLDPPDPNLAVGPNHVVTAVNAAFAVMSKSSPAPLAPLPLVAMFGGVLPPGADFMFDPKLAYDHFAQRWIMG